MHLVDIIPTTASSSIRLPLALGDVGSWLANPEAGTALSYHVGFLVLDRGAGSRLGKEAGAELDRVAAALMAMAEAGRLHLVQRRHGPCHYTYLAVVARRRTGARRAT